MKDYLLLNGDKILFEFDYEFSNREHIYQLKKLYADPSLLPIEFRTYGYSEQTLAAWVGKRVAPMSREHMEELVKAINLQNKFDILLYCYGLSLNDTYWVKEKNDPITFQDVNLYDNPFDETLGQIAFTGVPTPISNKSLTPEFTTDGALPKYWQNGISLTKGSTSGYANAGGEPYSEVIASLIAKKLNINAIPYTLEKRDGKPVSICKLFTSKQYGLLTMNKYLRYKFNGALTVSFADAKKAILEALQTLEPLYDMCFFDWLIKNDDRHLNNWGFLIDNETQQIECFAPIWDNGMSLLWSSMEYDFPNAYDYNNYFSSFNIPYDFVMECEYRQKYIDLCKHLLLYLNSKEAIIDFSNVFGDDSKHNWKTSYIIKMLKRRCNQYTSLTRE